MIPPLSGKVFDIRRFSTHDGDGIRTTVFLKGCSLRCVWCQNPEGISTTMHILHFRNRCIRCGLCAKYNPDVIIASDGYPDVSSIQAETYSRVIDACPAAALAMDCRILTVSQVMEEVCRDKAFFDRGGGVTFSGGEPFTQFPFLLKLLKETKSRGLHTAVETSLYTQQDNLLQAFPYIDLLYADCKIFEETQHRKLTGVSNELILDNLTFALHQKPPDQIIVRTPLIPGFTDSEKNIRQIAAHLSVISPEVRYELLNYNPLAEAKYVHVNLPFCYTDNPQPFTQNQMDSFVKLSKNSGVKNVTIG